MSARKVLLGLSRRFALRAPRAQPVNLRGRFAIVTGASRGSIGHATAQALAAWGADVVVTTRQDPRACAASFAASSGRIEAYAMDLTRAESVEAFVRWYRARSMDRLDLLVNNAGIHADLMRVWKEPQRTPDGFELHYRTNFLGPMQLTSLLLPSLLRRGTPERPARVLFVSSHLHELARNAELFGTVHAYDSWAAYGRSKLALIHGAFELHRRYASQHVHAYALHPGSVATNIAVSGLGSTPRLQRLLRWLAPLQRVALLSPEQAAQTLLHCATAPELAGGRYFERCAPASPSLECDDAAAAGQLWEETQRWLAGLARGASAEVWS